MAYNQQSLTQYGHTVLFPKSDPNIGCLAAFRNPPSETDYANKNVYPTLGGYGPPILAHIKRTNVGQQPQTKLQSQLKFDFHHDVPDSEIVEQATNDVYNHGSNWQRLMQERTEEGKVEMLLDFPALRQALCFEPEYMDSRVASVIKGDSSLRQELGAINELAKAILSGNPMVHLILNQTAREIPVQFPAPVFWYWMVWRDSRVQYVPLPLIRAMERNLAGKLSDDYIHSLVSERSSPLLSSIDFSAAPQYSPKPRFHSLHNCDLSRGHAPIPGILSADMDNQK